jgi:hypothetical protein
MYFTKSAGIIFNKKKNISDSIRSEYDDMFIYNYHKYKYNTIVFNDFRILGYTKAFTIKHLNKMKKLCKSKTKCLLNEITV